MTLQEAILHFIDTDAYAMMKKVGINRVSIFNMACREAFILNDQSEYAHTLRHFGVHLNNTGILLEELP